MEEIIKAIKDGENLDSLKQEYGAVDVIVAMTNGDVSKHDAVIVKALFDELEKHGISAKRASCLLMDASKLVEYYCTFKC